MTLDEARRALGIPAQNADYLARIVKAHVLKHYPFGVAGRRWGYHLRGLGIALSGAFVEHMERCEDCRIAIRAARQPDREYHVEMSLSPAHPLAQDLAELDDLLDHAREGRIGG